LRVVERLRVVEVERLLAELLRELELRERLVPLLLLRLELLFRVVLFLRSAN
jgi:hypothetical protein